MTLDDNFLYALADLIERDKLGEALSYCKQVFAEAGYVNLSDRGGLIHTTLFDKRGRIEYMTGQEWYKRFEKLANELPPDMPVDSPRETALDLAKKAAGLE